MTVSNNNREAGPFIGNNVTTVFPFTFKVFKETDLLVARTGSDGVTQYLTLNSDYVVALNSNQNFNPGGTVTLSVPLAVTISLVITSDLELLQPVDITNNGGFYPTVINGALDRLTIFAQQSYSQAKRSLRVPVSDAGFDGELPSAAIRANKALTFDSQGRLDVGSLDRSELVTFLQAGDDAVSRSVRSKLQDTISAFDFLSAPEISDVQARSVAIDISAPLQAALNSFGPNGGVLVLPPGAFRYSFLDVPSNVVLRGSGQGSTILYSTQLTDNTIVMHSSSGIEDLVLSSSAPRTAGRNIAIDGNGSFVRRLTIYNYYIGIDVVNLAVGVSIDSVTFGLPSLVPGGCMVLGSNYSNLKVHAVIGTGPAAGLQPSYGIRLLNGDTCFISDTNITLHGAALSFDNPANLNIYATHISNSLFDSAIGHSNCEMTGAGNVYDTKFVNVWFGLGNQQGCLINPSGAGVVDGVGFSNCEFPDNGDSGLRVNGVNAKNIFVDGGWSGSNAFGYNFSGGCSHFRINGVRAGNVAGRGPNTAGGIVIQAGASDYYTITGCDLSLNGGPGLSDSGTGTHKFINGNLV